MSSTLAIVLIIALGILLIVGLGALVLYKRIERKSASRALRPVPVPLSPQQELSALGILEIRPKSRKTEPAPASETPESDQPAPASDGTPAAPAPASAARSPLKAETSDEALPSGDAHLSTDAPGSTDAPPEKSSHAAIVESGRSYLIPLLRAMRSAVGGYTVCLVRHEEDNRYDLLAIVSESEHAVTGGSFMIQNALLVEALALAPVSVKDIGTEDVTSDALGYYRVPIPVRQLALIPVRVPDDEHSYLLLVDALAWQDLDDPWQRLLMGQFATLIGTYMASPLPGDVARGDRLRIRPRREIIAEEMERARRGDHPLALALIYLNNAEDIASQGVKALGAAERALKKSLEHAVRNGRLERFGELTYGVFHDNDVSEVEAWALHLQEELGGNDRLSGGVSIGIALLKDRHAGPDEFRADATEALREAFETGACTIIE